MGSLDSRRNPRICGLKGGGPDMLVARRWAKEGGMLPLWGLMEPSAIVRYSRPQPWATGHELHGGQRLDFFIYRNNINDNEAQCWDGMPTP